MDNKKMTTPDLTELERQLAGADIGIELFLGLRAAIAAARERDELRRVVDEVCDAVADAGVVEFVDSKGKAKWRGVGVALVARDVQRRIHAALAHHDGSGEGAK